MCVNILLSWLNFKRADFVLRQTDLRIGGLRGGLQRFGDFLADDWGEEEQELQELAAGLRAL